MCGPMVSALDYLTIKWTLILLLGKALDVRLPLPGVDHC